MMKIQQVAGQATGIVTWWGTVAAFTAVKFWKDIPGPTWLKILLIIVCIAIPGGFDEALLIASPKIAKLVRNYLVARKARKLVQSA